MRLNQFIYLIVFILSLFVQKEGLSQPKFISNKGQFESHVEFKLDHAAGRFYFQKDKVTYQLFDNNILLYDINKLLIFGISNFSNFSNGQQGTIL